MVCKFWSWVLVSMQPLVAQPLMQPLQPSCTPGQDRCLPCATGSVAHLARMQLTMQPMPLHWLPLVEGIAKVSRD